MQQKRNVYIIELETIDNLTFCCVKLYVTPRNFKINNKGSNPIVSLSNIWIKKFIYVKIIARNLKRDNESNEGDKPDWMHCYGEDCLAIQDSPE